MLPKMCDTFAPLHQELNGQYIYRRSYIYICWGAQGAINAEKRIEIAEKWTRNFHWSSLFDQRSARKYVYYLYYTKISVWCKTAKRLTTGTGAREHVGHTFKFKKDSLISRHI